MIDGDSPNTSTEHALVERLDRRTFRIRKRRVMIDSDLAALYGMSTRRFNEQIRRNLERFPEGVLLQLNEAEAKALRSHYATSKKRKGGRRSVPLVFADEGVSLLPSILKRSSRAVINFKSKAHLSFKTDRWETPQKLYDQLHREFNFTLDPCATKQNAKCAKFYISADDGLIKDWGRETVFMNPPYGRGLDKWIKKAYEASQSGATVVCLLPARTDTRWWHEYALRGEIRYVAGRLKFGTSENGAPFANAIIIFRARASRAKAKASVKKTQYVR